MTRGKIIWEPSSFRDPSGQVFYQNKKIYRRINFFYQDNYDWLLSSKLYQRLTQKKLLIPHREISLAKTDKQIYKIIQPQPIPFLSYPYEWSFSQLKDAALTTLKIQKISLEHKMSLKDASAYNLQFLNGKPILIDTLSFEKYQSGKPWVAYRQFCQHFLAPLALMSQTDLRLNQLLRPYLDGLPLDLVSRLLPKKTWFNFPLLFHLHLHAKSQRHLAGLKISFGQRRMKTDLYALKALIKNLEAAVKKLSLPKLKTEWRDYYSQTNYSKTAFNHKKHLVSQFLKKTKPQTVWDLGANVGEFSRMAAKKKAQTICFDIDPMVVEENYLQLKKERQKNLLPLVSDLTNPSPGLGWANIERKSLIERGPAEMILALALVHHLAITHNLPFTKIAEFLAKIGQNLIIEFIPKTDSQVQKMLITRKDIFPNYTQKDFEKEFGRFFKLKKKSNIKNSKRLLYLMAKTSR